MIDENDLMIRKESLFDILDRENNIPCGVKNNRRVLVSLFVKHVLNSFGNIGHEVFVKQCIVKRMVDPLGKGTHG